MKDWIKATQAPIRLGTDPEAAVRGADIVCTVTSAVDPILDAGMVAPGTHLNIVGSSGPAQAEIDGALVAAGLIDR